MSRPAFRPPPPPTFGSLEEISITYLRNELRRKNKGIGEQCSSKFTQPIYNGIAGIGYPPSAHATDGRRCI